MPLTPRIKKYTDYSYLVTNPPSEDAVRVQMDGAVQEVFDTVQAEMPLKTELGTLASLLTTVKTSAVAAINELFTNKANKTQEPWITPTLLNGWANQSGVQPCKYMKDSLGFVHIQGVVISGSSTIFILAAGYRPEQTSDFMVSANDTVGRVRINVDGTIVPQVGASAPFYLDIVFKAGV